MEQGLRTTIEAVSAKAYEAHHGISQSASCPSPPPLVPNLPMLGSCPWGPVKKPGMPTWLPKGCKSLKRLIRKRGKLVVRRRNPGLGIPWMAPWLRIVALLSRSYATLKQHACVYKHTREFTCLHRPEASFAAEWRQLRGERAGSRG